MIFNMTGGGSGSGATLVVSCPANVTVTVSKDDKSYTKNSGSLGSATFKGLATGEWTVTIEGNEQTATKNITITADYAITMAFFAAYINITYPANSTCTVKTSGGTTVASDSNTDSSAKTWTATVNSTGTYTITATATDGSGKSKSTTVSITADGQSESVTLRYGIDLINGNDITGGWSVGYSQNSTPTITTGTDKITVSSKSTDTQQANICTAVTNNLIDLSEFTKITVNVTDVNILSAGEIRVGLVKSRKASSLVSSVKITTKKEYSLSITPGSYYVAIYVKGDIDGAEVKVASYVTVDKLVAS